MATDRFTDNDILTTINAVADKPRSAYSLEDKVNLSFNVVKLQSNAFISPDFST